MRKVVMKLDLRDDKEKQRAIRAISDVSGIDSIKVDMEEKKMTVEGDVDSVEIVRKLRKIWQTDIISIGAAKEEKAEKGEDPNDPVHELVSAYKAFNSMYYYYPPNA